MRSTSSFLAGLAVAILIAGSGMPEARAQNTLSFDLPAQPLVDSLKVLSNRTNLNVFFEPKLVAGLQAPAIKAQASSEEALTLLLKGSGLTFRHVDEKTLTIIPIASTAESGASALSRGASPIAGERGENSRRLAQNNDSNTTVDGASAGSTEESSEQNNQTKNQEIHEIVVTAQKREERLQDVPMSIAVITNQEIERRGLIGMEDYLRSIPGVNQIDNGAQSNAIVIRGITTGPQFENFNAGTTVASFFDETSITAATGPNTGGIDVRPVDIERIEVLRGPQGTTYGSASLSGALRIIPVKPKLDGFEAKAAVSYSDTSGPGRDNNMVQGILNVPLLTDKFALRAVGYRYDMSGYYGNVVGTDSAMIARAQSYGLGSFVQGFTQDNVGQMVSTGGRLSGLWAPTDRLALTLSYLTQKIEQDGRPEAQVGKYEQIRVPIAPQARLRGEAGEGVDTDLDLAYMVLNYDLGWSALTSVVSWADGGSVYATDGTPTTASIPNPYPRSAKGVSDYNSWSAETRLASKLGGRFQFLAGLFYEDIDEEGLALGEWPGTPATRPVGTTNPLSVFDFTRKIQQRAVFGEASYKLTDKLTATLGGRYFDYDKNQGTLIEGFGVIPIGSATPTVLKGSEEDSTFKANVSYKFSGDALLFASWAQGFRLGRPNTRLPANVCDINNDGLIDGTSVSLDSTSIVNSDSLDNYEIGSKFTFLDQRLTVEAFIYQIDWKDIPARVAVPCGAYVTNAGSAEVEGAELQASLLITRGLRLDFGTGYNKAELSKDVPAQGWRKGQRLPGSPKVNANFAAQYDFDLAGHKAFIRADSFYTGTFYGDFLQSQLTGAGNYIKIDARAGMSFENLSVELFGQNLTNEDTFTWRGLANANSAFGYRLRPRTFGLQLGYSFR